MSRDFLQISLVLDLYRLNKKCLLER